MSTRSLLAPAGLILVLALLAAGLLRPVAAQETPPASFTMHRVGIDHLGAWSMQYSHNGGATLIIVCEVNGTEVLRFETDTANRFVDRWKTSFGFPVCPEGGQVRIGMTRWQTAEPPITPPTWFGPWPVGFGGPGSSLFPGTPVPPAASTNAIHLPLAAR